MKIEMEECNMPLCDPREVEAFPVRKNEIYFSIFSVNVQNGASMNCEKKSGAEE